MSDTSRYVRPDTQEIKVKISQQKDQVKCTVTDSKINESNLDNLEITDEDIALMRKELNAYKLRRENKVMTCLKNLALRDSKSNK